MRFAAVALSLALLVPYGLPASVAAAEPDDLVGGVRLADDPSRASVSPQVRMPAGVLWTLDGRALWERRPYERRSMASTTKIMTALVALEAGGLDEQVSVSAAAARVGEAGIGLSGGQTVTVRELIEGTLIKSGNDAATALAEHVAGSTEAFVIRMNQRAAELGLTHTAYTNPHGLDEPGHHTCAADLATLASVAMADPVFAEMVARPEMVVRRPNGTTGVFENSNKLIGTYPGATGVKTGWTSKAGYCLVASAERDGVAFVAVVLGGVSEDDRFAQAATLLDWGFAHYRNTPLASADETAALVPVSDYLDRTVAAIVAEDAVAPVFDIDGDVTRNLDLVADVAAPVERGQRLGTLTIRQGDRLLAQVPVVAASAIERPGALERITIWFTRLWRSIAGGQQIAAPAALM